MDFRTALLPVVLGVVVGAGSVARAQAPGSGGVRGSVAFDSSSAQSLTTPVVDPRLNGSSFTLAMWAQVPLSLYEAVAHRWDDGGQVWWLGHFPYGRMSVGIAQSTSGAGGVGRDFATTFVPGTWHHFVVTYDAGNVRLFADGLPDDGTINGAIPSSLTQGTSPLYLGQSIYTGSVGEALFFDRALTASEVADVYCVFQRGAAGCACGVDQHACTLADATTIPGLVSYWPLGADASDAVGSNDLVEINGPLSYTPHAGGADAGVAPDSGTSGSADAGVADSGASGPADAGVADSGAADGGVVTASGTRGAVTFDRSAAQALTTPVGAGSPLNASAFTIGMWMQMPLNPYEAVANRWDDGGQVWWLGHVPPGRFAMGIAQGVYGAGGIGRDFATSFAPGSRQHVIVTYENGTLHMYANGAPDDGPVNGPIPTSLTGGTSPLYIGQSIYSGDVGEVVFYDRAVTPQEAADIYCAFRRDANACPVSSALQIPGLVSYWPLGANPLDAVGGHHLTELNGPLVYTPHVAPSDAGTSGSSPDAGTTPDAGTPDAGTPDAGTPDSGAQGSGAADGGFGFDGSIAVVPYVPPSGSTGGYATFDRTARQSLSVPVPTGSPLNPSAFSIAMWAQFPTNRYEAIAHRWDAGGQSWWLGHFAPGRLSLGIAQSVGGAGGLGRDFASAFAPGSWHHVVVTYDAGTVNLYADGALDNGTVNGSIPTNLTGGASPLYIGQDVYSGGVGDVLFFDRALDATEVSDLFCTFDRTGSGCGCGPDDHTCALDDALTLPNLVSFWPLATGPQDLVGGQHLTENNGPIPYVGSPASGPPALPTYSGGACPTLTAGHNTISVNGTPRGLTIQLPPNPIGAPVMFAWHWTDAGITGQTAIDMQGLGYVPAVGAILVAPDGVRSPFHWYHGTTPVDNPDLTFFDDMLACLDSNFQIDRDRVYAMGHSSGGLMTSYLVMHRGEHLAAAASLSGGHYGGPAGGSTTYPIYHSPRSAQVPNLLIWGGSSDYYAPTNLSFDIGNQMFSQLLRDDGHFVIECRGNFGHSIPDDTLGESYVWDFLSAHTRGMSTLPFAGGSLPAGAPGYCVTPPIP